MKHLNKKQIEEIEAHRAKLEDARRVIEEAISKAQVIIDEAVEEVNGWREEAAECVREIYGKLDDYMSERSPEWLLGEKGDVYYGWREVLDEAANSLEEELIFDMKQIASEELDVIEQWAGILEDIPHAPEE